MYLSFYGLKENPFQISTNPHFLWLGEKHQEALASLRYGVLGNKGFLLLTGGVGTGKTTLINALLASLDKDVLAVTIPDPGLDQLDLYYFIANSFKIQEDFPSKGRFLVIFSKFLHEMHEQGKKVLLIIDEAQRLSPSMLEEIRLLSNIELPDSKLINIFFVGQMEFNAILLRQENRALRQRITVNYHIHPLSLAETTAYLDHRLKVAGASRSLFNSKAVKQIYYFSRGFPRLINVIADRALLTGFVQEMPEVSADIVLECAQELKIPEPKKVFRKTKPIKVQPPVQQEDHEEFEVEDLIEQEDAVDQEGETEKEEVNEQKKLENKEVSGQPVKQPSGAESKAEQRPSSKAEEKLHTEILVARPEKSGMPMILSILLGILVIAAAVFLWFNPAGVPNGVQKVLKKVFPPGQEQVVPPAPVTQGSGGTPGKGSSENGNTKSDLQSGSSKDASAKPANLAPVVTKDTADGSVSEEKSGPAPAEMTVADMENATDQKENQPGQSGSKEIKSNGGAVQTGSAAAETEAKSPSRPLVVGFDWDSNNLSTYGVFMLNQLVEQVQNKPYSQIIVRGYSDAMGSESYNKSLSLFRANMVKSYLIAKGIKPATIVTLGLGTKNPLASNDTAEGRRKNRRVEIEVQP